jgi:hypothetical protein
MLLFPPMERIKLPLSAAYYRRRERELRALAGAMTDASLQKQMLDIANEYARLAEQAEAWERDHPER